MIFLLSAPGGGSWILILLAIVVLVYIPVACYRGGFRNGVREGERRQLQKQVDKINK
jgi:hypothetical protein